MGERVLAEEFYSEPEIEVLDLVPQDEQESGSGVLYAVLGGGVVAAVAGAIVGGKKLLEKHKEKKLERAIKLVEESGRTVTEVVVDELDTLQSLEEEVSSEELPTKEKSK